MAKRGSSSQRSFSDNTTTTFPKVGDNGVIESVVNVSGQRSPYTKAVPKKTGGRGASPTGKAANKSGYQISEANGPRCNISVPMYAQNAAEASMTERNTKFVSSTMGNADEGFGSYRQYGQRV